MPKPSFLKLIVVGAVAGLLGAGLQSAAIALIDTGHAVEATTFLLLLSRLLSGAAIGIFWAFVYRFMPPVFWLEVVIVWALTTSISWLLVFVRESVVFNMSLLAHSLIGNLVFAVATAFTLHQSIFLALPLVPMGRRAEEFSDNPSGA